MPDVQRTEPDLAAGERDTLNQFLDHLRAGLLGKADGLTAAQLKQPLPTSSLTLAGLLKHLALVEDDWFTFVFAGGDEVEPWASAPFDDDRDWEFHSATDDDGDYLRELYAAACARSRAVAAAGALDQLSARARRDGRRSLRWILVHMIEETARHCGHADLLREAIDGVTG